MSDGTVSDGTDGDRDEERVASRASDLLPEEQVVGSDDPEAQAEAILDDSEARTNDRSAAPDTVLEHRTSDDATEPPT